MVTEDENEKLLRMAGVDTGKDYVDTGELLNIIVKLQREINTSKDSRPWIPAMVARSIAYGVNSELPRTVSLTVRRNLVSEILHSMNRKRLLTNKQTEKAVREAYTELKGEESPISRIVQSICEKCKHFEDCRTDCQDMKDLKEILTLGSLA